MSQPKHPIETLTALRSPPRGVDWHVELVSSQANGGKTTAQDLDTALEPSTATVLTVSGLDQKALEHLASRFGKQLTAVHFWKCPRITDLSPIEEMSELAWLRAKLPAHVGSSVLQPFRLLADPLGVGGKELDVLVMGKGKPFLSRRDDSDRLQRYVEAFNQLVAKYAADPGLPPA